MASAQYFLGGCYRDGKGVGTNIVEAVTWFRKPQNDLALLKADGRFASLPHCRQSHGESGGTVATVGFPNIGLQGFSPKLAKGEITSLSGAGDDARYFQISVPGAAGAIRAARWWMNMAT